MNTQEQLAQRPDGSMALPAQNAQPVQNPASVGNGGSRDRNILGNAKNFVSETMKGAKQKVTEISSALKSERNREGAA
jgi:hypothetical protein